MRPAVEDLIGKMLMIGIFAIMAGRQAIGLAQMLASPVKPPLWVLGTVSQFLSLLFVAVVVLMTVRRLPPRQSAAGIEPRVTAIGGTFALILLVWLPAGQGGLVVQLTGLALLLVGTIFSIYCLHYLGRSFSIMASARELVTRGPYGVVRHPLYLAEGISTIGIIMLHWSLAAVVVGAVQIALQFRRMQNEEAVLRAAFPAYGDYAERVPMIVPGRRRQAAGA